MHQYSLPNSRGPVYGLLAIPAIAAAIAISWALSRVHWPAWLVSPPSVLGTYALALFGFDRWGWKTGWARLLGLTKVPDVSGTYTGQLVSSRTDNDGEHVRRPVRFEISQTWTEICIYMKVTTGSSTSQSDSAVAHLSSNPNYVELRYLYTNKVNPAIADVDMFDHDGAAELRIQAPTGELTGRYFNGRLRSGSIQASRAS